MDIEVKQYNAKCVQLLLHLAFQGNELAIRQLCQEVNVPYEWLENSTHHIDPPTQERLWNKLAQRVDVQELGLHLGQQLGTTWGGFVNLMAQVSPTLYHLLHDFGQHKALFTDPSYYEQFGAVDQGDWTYFEITFPDTSAVCYPFYCRHTAEGMFVLALQILQTLGRHPLRPVKIYWQHPEPDSLALYQAIFQAPMRFNTGVNRLYFRRSELVRPLVTYNPSLYAHFHQVIETYGGRKEENTWSEQVRFCVLRRLRHNQSVVIDQIAEALNQSVRSLQRKLVQEQMVFGHLVEEVRKEIACQLLRNGHHSIPEVAQLLGYNEPSSFRRAFKRWTGQSPKSYSLTA